MSSVSIRGSRRARRTDPPRLSTGSARTSCKPSPARDPAARVPGRAPDRLRSGRRWSPLGLGPDSRGAHRARNRLLDRQFVSSASGREGPRCHPRDRHRTARRGGLRPGSRGEVVRVVTKGMPSAQRVRQQACKLGSRCR